MKKITGLCMLGLVSSLACAQTPLLKLVVLQPLDQPKVMAVKATLDSAFARAGLRYSLEYNPGERALAAFKDGAFDGDANRLATFNQAYPGALRVEPHLNGAFFYAIGTSRTVKPAAWSELTKYSVAYVRGFRGIEIRLADVAVKALTDSEEACLKMALAKRVDWCVLASDRTQGWPLQQQYGDRLQGTLFDTEKVHMWLGPQHKEAAERLTRALREMEKSGDLQRRMASFRQPD